MKTLGHILMLAAISFLAAGCASKIFKYTKKTDDFWLCATREDSAIPPDNNPLKKFNQGVYMMQICKMDTIIEAVPMKWLRSGPCYNDDSLYQYAYFVFLDDYRVLYFTEYKKCCFEQQGTLQAGIDYCLEAGRFEPYFSKNQKIDFFNEKNLKMLRGYYKVRNDLPYSKNSDIYDWNIEMELEKMNERKPVWLNLGYDLETNTLKILDVALKYDYDVLPYNIDFDNGVEKSEARYRRVVLDNIFSVNPGFTFMEKIVHFYRLDCKNACAEVAETEKKDCLENCEKNKSETARLYFDKIEYLPADSSIFYKCKDQVLFSESLKKADGKKFESW